MTSPLITKAEVNSVFQGRSLLAEKDFTPAEINYLVDFGLHLKALKQQNIPHHYLEGKNIALLFAKTSTRTRAAFTTAAIDLGAHPEYLGHTVNFKTYKKSYKSKKKLWNDPSKWQIFENTHEAIIDQ